MQQNMLSRAAHLTLLLVIPSFAARAIADTNVGGPIVTNTTWTAAGSPYIVTSSIIIGGGAALTIQPGVTVRVNGTLGITVGSTAFGTGALKVLGSASQPVLFTSNSAQPAPGQWQGIKFTDQTIDAVVDAAEQYVSGSILQHCTVEYAGSGPTDSGCIQITQSSPLIDHCELRMSARSAIRAQNGLSVPKLRIRSCVLHDNNLPPGMSGAGAYLECASLQFSGNKVRNNSASAGAGMVLLGSPDSTTGSIRESTFEDNSAAGGWGGAIQFFLGGASASWTLDTNTFKRNVASIGGAISFDGSSSDPQSISISNCVFADNLALAATSGLQAQGGGAVFRRPTFSSWQINLVGNDFHYNTASAGITSQNALGGALVVINSYSTNSFSVTAKRNVFQGNSAVGGVLGGAGLGGAIYVEESAPSGTTTVNLSGEPSNHTFNSFTANSAHLGKAIYLNMAFNKNGSNDLHAEYVCWGGDDPNPSVSPNLIYDFFDNPQKAFVIYPPAVSGADCPSTGTCAPGEILDCNGNCAPAAWLGDGVCDNGTYLYRGIPITFDCSKFSRDAGDCDPPSDPFTTPPNQGQPATPTYDHQVIASIERSTAQNLVVVVHGFNTDACTFQSKWVALADNISNRISAPGNWDVLAYDWTEQCGRVLTVQDALQVVGLANSSASTGFMLGLDLGRVIGAKGFAHVHLIGHSAGSALITAAARAIRNEASVLGIAPPTIHTTYLDAFVPPSEYFGGMNAQELYGADADFADQYFAKKLPEDITGSWTARVLPHARNVDVTQALDDYACTGQPCDNPLVAPLLCGHGWPVQLFGRTVQGSDACTFGGVPLAYDLSKEHFALQGDWLAYVHSLEVGAPAVALTYCDCSPGCAAGGSGTTGDSDAVPFARFDPPLDPLALQAFVSSAANVSLTHTGVTLSTEPSESACWANLQFVASDAINQVKMTVHFTDAEERVGLLTLYIDGKKFGFADEAGFGSLDGQPFSFYLPGEFAAGTHVLSLRLDDQAAGSSTVRVSNITTGLSRFVPLGDLDGDGHVTGTDLGLLLGSWGLCQGCPADLDRSGSVDGIDLGLLLGAWTG